MQISENYKIESDVLNVTLFYRKAGKKNWIAIGYFSNPHNALDYMVEREIMGTGMADLKTVVRKIEALEGSITSLKGLPDIVQCLPSIAKDKTGGKHRAQVVTA